jgi:hypothetical protein
VGDYAGELGDGANTVDVDATVFSSPRTITLTGSQPELSNTGGTAAQIPRRLQSARITGGTGQVL